MKIVLVSFIVILSSCAIKTSPSRRVDIGLFSKLRPIPPETANLSMAVTQKYTITSGSTVFRFPAQLELTPEKWVIVGMTLIGNRGFLLEYSNKAFLFDHIPFFNLPISSRSLLVHLQLATTDLDLIRPYLKQIGLSISQISGENMTRVIRKGRAELIRIIQLGESPFHGKLIIQNRVQNFTIEISNYAAEPILSDGNQEIR